VRRELPLGRRDPDSPRLAPQGGPGPKPAVDDLFAITFTRWPRAAPDPAGGGAECCSAASRCYANVAEGV